MNDAGEEDMFTESSDNPSEIQGLLKKLLDCDNPQQTSTLVDKTLNILRKLPSDNGSRLDYPPDTINQLHGMGVALWNKAVTLKTAAAVPLDINAQLRHVSFTTVLLCNLSEASFQLTCRYITMALKTARAWLDCENYEMAETSLQLANQYWERMVAKYPSEAESPDTFRLLFKILCSQIESALGIMNEDNALALITKTKDLLKHLANKESMYLTILCYNLGLQQFQCEKYASSVDLLKESYDVGRISSSDNMAIKQARTLRLLAASYLELDGQVHWQKALNAISLANSEYSHPAGLLLKNRILLQYMPHMNDRISAAMDDILSHPDTTLEIGISAIRETHKNGRHDLAINALCVLKQKPKFLLDKETLEQVHLELLLENNNVSEAKSLVEAYIRAHDSGDVMNTQATQNFNTLLWNQASKAYENKDFSLAIQWYQYSLVLLSIRDSPHNQDAAKLQRNCCLCCIELEEYEKAEEMVKQAIENDSESSHSHFLLFKVSVFLNKEDEAKSALQAMIECSKGSEDIPGLLGLAAQMAFERNSNCLAIEALECISRNPQDSKHALTSLRCLIRMKMSLLTHDVTSEANNLSHLRTILHYIQSAEQHIGNLSAEPLRESETTWFMKISWNTGLQASEAFQEIAEAFEACRKFCSLLPKDKGNYFRQRTCLLMATSALLQLARNTIDTTEKTILMESVLAKVKQYHELSSVLDNSSPSDPTPSLLLLYQLEAQLYLGTLSSSNEVMTMISSLSQVEPKIYETVAGLIIQNPPREGGALIAQNALRAAINLYSESPKPDPERLSRCSHSLIQLLIGREDSSDMVTKEQAMIVFKNTLKFLDGSVRFSDMEVQWHMVKAWNTGIHLYSGLRYKDAEAWCSLSMKFLPHLPPNLLETYRSKMTSVYDEILEKIDKPIMP